MFFCGAGAIGSKVNFLFQKNAANIGGEWIAFHLRYFIIANIFFNI